MLANLTAIYALALQKMMKMATLLSSPCICIPAIKGGGYFSLLESEQTL